MPGYGEGSQGIYRPDGSADMSGALERFSVNAPENLDEIEAADLAEIAEEDPQFREELTGAFQRAAERNKGNLTVFQKIVRIATVLGIAIAAVPGISYASHTEVGSDIKNAVAGSVKTAGDALQNIGERSDEEKVGRIIMTSSSEPKTVQAGLGIDQFLDTTEWRGEYPDDIIEEAIRVANKDNKSVDMNNLQPGDQVFVPVRHN